ncbi:MAG: M23 family metallopeptidase [Deltaproteobacteria bacterium]|nr:M23 family metallopeptidase [Deltaproteobacteria bacterium]
MARMEKESSTRPHTGMPPFLYGLLLFLLIPSFVFFSSSSDAAKRKKEGVYHIITQGETLYRISLAYKVPVARLMEANGLSSAKALRPGKKILIPGAKAVRKVEPFTPLTPVEKKDLEDTLEVEEEPVPPEVPPEKETAEKPPWYGKELDIIWPIQGKINSPFGPRKKRLHAGIDIDSPSYQEVRAAMDGEVILARHSNSRKGYGNVVVLRHDLAYTTIYGHMNVILMKEGEAVRQGQAVGGVGSTGRSTGPHLHFEIRHDGRPFDPLPILPMTLEDLLKKTSQK